MAKLKSIKTSTDSKVNPNSDRIPIADDLISPQLVIALCSPIGSPCHEISQIIDEMLVDLYGYETKLIRLSHIIKKIMKTCKLEYGTNGRMTIEEIVNEQLPQLPPDSTEKFRHKKTLIFAGNKIRKLFSQNNILTSHAISSISEDRIHNIEDEQAITRILKAVKSTEDFALLSDEDKKLFKLAQTASVRKCIIIDSLKNPDELKVLRDTYGRSLFVVGVFSSIEDRTELLSNEGLKPAEIKQLIDQDSGEEIEEGQSVRDIFSESDYFLRVGNHDQHRQEKVDRMLCVLFDSDLITPNRHETAMYYAASSAGNSACMSRQVGASITDDLGELISVGWNDVPKFGGNLYRTENLITNKNGPDINLADSRCYTWKGKDCHNDLEKDKVSRQIAQELLKQDLLVKDDNQAIKKTAKAIRDSEKFSNLIEFSRSIHAEMHAILSANASSLTNASLYCTTYPCHACARHIVAAGIKEVFYIEPYRKSLATDLHKDSISEEEECTNKVKLLVFEGVAPRRYLDLFKSPNNKKRKSSGKLRVVNKRKATPSICQTTLASVSALENIVIAALHAKEVELSQSHDLFKNK